MYNKFIFFNNNRIYYYIVGGYFILIFLGFYFTKNIGNYESRLKNLLLSQTIFSVESSSSNIIKSMIDEHSDFIYENRNNINIKRKNEHKLLGFLSDKDINSVYIVYIENNQLFYLLDASLEDRGETGELFLPAYENLFKEALQQKKTKTFIQPNIETLGYTLIQPIVQHNKIVAFLVLDYKENSLATLSSLLNASVTSLFYAIGFSLLILFFLIAYIIYTRYMRYKIYKNPQTNTLNRVFLTDNYEKIEFQKYYVALADLDFFKRINNIYGQENGDKVIISVMRRITTVLRDEDLFIQYGGEEFLLLISKEGMNEEVFKNLLESIRKLIETTRFEIDKDKFFLTISIGALLNTESEKSLQDVIHKADTALYECKHSGRNTVCCYDITQTERLYREKLKEMIESDKLVCYFQPINSLSTFKLHHYEALLRIEDGDNIIFPDKILPDLEDSYLYTFLTKRIIEFNVKILRADSQIKISINLSADDLVNESILSLLAQNSDLSERLYIEILENKSIDYERVESSIQQLKTFGYKICIDDFGSGYSNLNHLLNLSIDFLKIDGSIIKEVLNDKRAYSIVETFAKFCQDNNIYIIAEFIDNKEIIEVLKGFGVEYGQGFYFSQAKPYAELNHEEYMN